MSTRDDHPSWGGRLRSVLTWGFVIVFATVLAVAFGLALSRLEDRAVITVGVVALSAGVVGVGLQGIYVASQQDALAAAAYSDPDNLMGRNQGGSEGAGSAVRSYTLTVRPDVMTSMQNAFPDPTALIAGGLRLVEPGYVTCGRSVALGQVDYSKRVEFLVVSKGSASSNGFWTDVLSGQVTSVMMGGELLRIVALSGLDFAADALDAVVDLTTNDLYGLSQRGPIGSTAVPVAGGTTACSVTEVHLPWEITSKSTSTSTGSAAMASIRSASLSTAGGSTLPLLVWGVGGR